MAARDLSAPWYAPIRRDYHSVCEDACAGRWDRVAGTLNGIARERAIRNGNGKPLAFVDALAAGDSPYEAHIWRTGEVPTRSGAEGGWHDLFNALVWLSFPAIKSQLNRLQASAIAAAGVGSRRGALRDAATLFDESGAIVLTRDPQVGQALRAMRWRALFVEGRGRFPERVRVLVFGHALLDKLRHPYKAACAHAWVVDADPQANTVDSIVAAQLDERTLRPGAFAPLPVSGIPGWCAANEDPVFYDDAAVFRSARTRIAQEAEER